MLNEMESRYRAGDNNVTPDSISFNLAIRTCLQTGDTERAEVVMDRMEQSATPPDTRTYNQILQHWSKVGTGEAAERIEQIIARMKEPTSKPDCYSYSIAMSAWSKTGHSNGYERMWRLYEQMEKENLEPNFLVMTTLITALSKSKDQRWVERADALLQDMNDGKRPSIAPDHRLYVPVIRGWLDIGDLENATRLLMRFAYARSSTPRCTKPNSMIVDIVTREWIKAGNLVRATSLVDNIQALKDANLLPEGPGPHTYRHLVEAWVSSMHPERAVNVQRLCDKIAAFKSINRS
jgi:pentatricopeptide repeat protein